jgi:tetratricopeptide (TPR) repeat protein
MADSIGEALIDGASRPRAARSRLRAPRIMGLGGILLGAGLVTLVLAVLGRSGSPESLQAAARAHARAGKLAAAEALLARLERLRPPTAEDRLLRAQVAGLRERIDEAIAELEEIVDHPTLGVLALLSIGQLEARRGRLAPAEAAFRAVLARQPETLQARRELVYIYSVQQRLDEAEAQLDALSELGALDVGHLLHWCRMRFGKWAAETDLTPLERYVAADGDDRHSRLALAEAYRRVGRTDDALRTLKPLPETDTAARSTRAEVLLDVGDHATARALVEAGPAGDPALARLRGRLALFGGRPEEAARQFRAALAGDPGDRAALAGLASALGVIGDSQAAQPVKQAIERHDALASLVENASAEKIDGDPRMPLRLGLACAEAGRLREARAWLKQAIERDPLNQAAQRAFHQVARSLAATTGKLVTRRTNLPRP